MPAFSITTEQGGARLVVLGDLDAATAPQLRAAFETAPDDVELDLGSCTFMDSSGISVLTEARMRHSPDLRVVAASRPVRLVLEVSGLAEVFLDDLADDVADVDDSSASGRPVTS